MNGWTNKLSGLEMGQKENSQQVNKCWGRSWDWGADVELDSEEYDSDNVQPIYDSDDDTPMTG
ncbi:hypothetical protein Pyn_36238 [Prunus yedoensis var. nudiflora]|uniref:Uncharacterized protein n=1 Tax=Prunus yedoensis var. nudiflora TaxID=2094558 RepID=A0A314Y1V5_PRUYE|nr:hypothetical protein Pyn_36238 [Prunus yedoensis var. nudiflora]